MIPRAAEVPDARSTRVTKLLTVARNIRGSSVGNLLHITVLAAGIFLWLVDFCKIYPLLVIPTQGLIYNMYEDYLRIHALVFEINLLNTNGRHLYLKTQSVPRCKHFSSRL